MKTLVLSCNTGEGHNSCARAIKEYYESAGEVCDVEDSLAFVSKRVSDIISRWHVRIYRRAPKLFTKGYSFLEDHPRFSNERSALYRLIAMGSKKLEAYIKENGYDCVVCTHVISASMLSYAIERHGLSLKASGLLITDYTCHPFASDSRLDVCFMPDETLKDEFNAHGISEDRLFASGIPVRNAFFTRTPKREAKRSLGIDPNFRHLLVMCGSMGCGPIPDLVKKTAKILPEGCVMTVICGTNKKLYSELSRRYSSNSGINVLGYTDNVSLLMDSADLYLTKPGGISVTEAAVKELPMVYVNAVAGCENGNLSFFVGRGCAVTDDDTKKLAATCADLLTDDEALEKMRESFAELKDRNGAREIYGKMKSLAEAAEPACIG